MPGVPLATMRKDQATSGRSSRCHAAAAVKAGGTGMLGDPVLALVVRLLGLLAVTVRNARRR